MIVVVTANQGEGEAADSAGGQPGGKRPLTCVRAEALGEHSGPPLPGLLPAYGQIPGEPGKESGSQL